MPDRRTFPTIGSQRGAPLAYSGVQAVRVSRETGDDQAATVGDPWRPFATFEKMREAVGSPSSGPYSQVPLAIWLDGSPSAASPVATYLADSKFQLGSNWGIDITPAGGGGGDADRSRASALLKPTASGGFAGPVLEVLGRSVAVDNIGATNPHASGVGLAIGTTAIGGGFQGFHSRNFHAFGCGLAGVRMSTFNTDGADFFELNVQNNPGYAILFDDQAHAVDLPNHTFLRNIFTSNSGTGTLPAPFTGKPAQIGFFSTLASPDASGEGVYIDGWEGHGTGTRLWGEGPRNLHARKLYWENSQDQTPDTPQIMLRKGTGTGGTAPTHYCYNVSVDLGRVHGLTHSVAAGWSAGKPLWLDIDECVNFVLGRELEFHQTDATAINPLALLDGGGFAGTSMAQLDFGVVSSSNNRANRLVTAAALAVIGGTSATNHGTYFDGAVYPQVLP